LTSRTVERAPGRPRASGVQRFGALPVSVPGATIGCCAGVLTRGAEVLPDMPDNRELATATLLIGFVICGLTVRRARERIPDVVRSAAPLAGLLAFYLATASLTVWAAWSVGLWTADLWWSTAIVVLGLGMGLVSKAIDARSARALWDSIGGTTIGSAVFIGLYANLIAFPLIVELVLQALGALALMLRVVADYQDQKPVRRLADVVLATIGLALLARTTTVLARGMPGDEWVGLLKQLLLSIWFPFALVPLLYLLSYFSTVELAVVNVRVVASRRIGKWPLVWRFLPAFRLRLSLAAAFDREWGRRYANASSRRERRRVLSQFRHVQRPRFAMRRRVTVQTLFRRVIGRSNVVERWDGRAMPRTPAHLVDMLDVRPPGWEQMAFGAGLWIGMADQGSGYRNYRQRHARRRTGRRLEPQTSLSHLADELARGGSLGESIMGILSDERQERAFGLPGEPGSVDAIRDMAREMINLYATLVDWSASLRGTRARIRHKRAYRAAARLMDGPVQQLRQFVAALAMQLDQVPGHATSGDPRPLNIVLSVTLSIRDEDQASLDRALARLGRKASGALLELQT